MIICVVQKYYLFYALTTYYNNILFLNIFDRTEYLMLWMKSIIFIYSKIQNNEVKIKLAKEIYQKRKTCSETVGTSTYVFKKKDASNNKILTHNILNKMLI